ncbi:MAG: hypothetical protein H7066_17560 [Cytophagaceae bacterium]|nr:hypothetical protein [Gemmatimonadaceae bacterium]
MKKMDGAGLAKMQTLEKAQLQLQRVHGLVEQMALAIRSQQETAPFRQSITRTATPLAGTLKAQFGMIADQVTSLILVMSRGGGDQARLRALRELVAQTRTALDIAVTKTEQLHTSDSTSPTD